MDPITEFLMIKRGGMKKCSACGKEAACGPDGKCASCGGAKPKVGALSNTDTAKIQAVSAAIKQTKGMTVPDRKKFMKAVGAQIPNQEKTGAAMSQERREDLKASQFAVPESKAKKIGVSSEIKGEAKGKYPIPDERHARNALSRVSTFGTPAERAAVRSKVYAKYPQLRAGFEARHGGESPTSKENLKKETQGTIGKTASLRDQIGACMRQLVEIEKAACVAPEPVEAQPGPEASSAKPSSLRAFVIKMAQGR